MKYASIKSNRDRHGFETKVDSFTQTITPFDNGSDASRSISGFYSLD